MTIALLLPLQAFAAQSLRIDTILAPPLGFVTDEGQPTGLYYEISNRIAEAAGLSYTNQIVPFARAITELERGDADMSMFFRREGNPQLAPLIVVYTLKNVLIGRKGTQFDALDDLHGKLVAQTRRTHYGEAFENDPAITKVEVTDDAQGIAMLMNNRVDAYVGPEINIFFTAQQAGYAREDFGAPLEVSQRDVWVQTSAVVDEATQAALKAAAESLLAEGAIQQIVEKYTGE